MLVGQVPEVDQERDSVGVLSNVTVGCHAYKQTESTHSLALVVLN